MNTSRKLFLRNFLKNELDLPKNAPMNKIKKLLPLANGEIASDDYIYMIADEFYAIRKKEIDDKLKEITKRVDARNNAKKLARKVLAERISYASPSKDVKKLGKDKFEKVVTKLSKSLVLKKPSVSKYYVDRNTGFEEYRNIIRNFMGKTINVSGFGLNFTYDVPSNENDFKKFIRYRFYTNYDFRTDSDTMAWNNGGVLSVTVASVISQTSDKQSYKDGVTNCMLTPIKMWGVTKYENSKSERTSQRYEKFIKVVDELLNKYSSGVPQDKINEVCNLLQVNISVSLPFQTIPYVCEKSEKKCLTSFKYLNLRHDHVDEVIDTEDVKKCCRDEFEEMKNSFRETGVDYYFTGSRLYANGVTYEIGSRYNEFVSLFMKSSCINEWRIDAVKYPELSKFVCNGVHYNCCMDFEDNFNAYFDGVKFNDMKHIDQTCAYKNFTTCKYYDGFLAKITDFRVTDKIQGCGLYMIKDIVILDKKFKRLNDKMKFYENNGVYPSVALKFLHSVGSYTIVGGCWGIRGEVNMEFMTEDDTFMSKDEGVPFYSKFVGACNSVNHEMKYSLYGDKHTAEMIRNNTCTDVYRFDDHIGGGVEFEKRLIEVRTKKHSVKHLSHITAFVLEYTRLNIIEQLMNMNYSQIMRVNSDGVYCVGDVCCVNNYREKKSECFDVETGRFTTYNGVEFFCSGEIADYYKFGSYRDFYMTELAIGGGGSGKTHFNLVDDGLIDVMYISPSWKLARNKSAEYGCRVGTHAGLLGCDPTNMMYNAAVFLIDEVSMMSNEEKEKIMKFYSGSKLIFCGDLNYQLPFVAAHKKGVHTEFKIKGFNNVMEFNTDYRATCDVLKSVKSIIREKIDCGDMVDSSLLNNFKSITEAELREMYKVEDMILCKTNVSKNNYTSMFSHMEKYYVCETTLSHACGEILYSMGDKCELRHAFTVHSIQGETCRTNLFIDAAGMDMRMFYTAVSRAVNISQIYIL
jgi:hypothetical protein